jgi:hypothetical protein
MLMRTDPFRELDRLTQQVFGGNAGTWSRPTAMPMDAYRDGDRFVVAFDLPGVSPEAIELDVERNVLTVKAERRPVVTGEQVEMQVAERHLPQDAAVMWVCGQDQDGEPAMISPPDDRPAGIGAVTGFPCSGRSGTVMSRRESWCTPTMNVPPW